MTNEILWRVVGYDTRKQMNESLLYLEETQSQVAEKVAYSYPNLDVYYIARVPDDDNSWRNFV